MAEYFYFPETAIGLISEDLTEERIENLNKKGFTQHSLYPFLFNHKDTGKLWYDLRDCMVKDGWSRFKVSFIYLDIGDNKFLRVNNIYDIYSKVSNWL